MEKISYGIWNIPITYFGNVCEKEFIEQCVINAQKRLKVFASSHQLTLSFDKPFINSIQIFETQGDFINALRKTLFLDESYKLPKTVSAIVIDQTLLIISPSAYQKTYPIEGLKPKGYEKLISHELAHEMHIRILKGDEDKMGPEWFYEGFAIFAANQLTDSNITDEDFWKIIDNNVKTAYTNYSAVIHQLVTKISLMDLIKNAHTPEFSRWIHSVFNC